jgi:hypothetical protein
MDRRIHRTVEDYFHAIADLVDEPHQRVDDRRTRLMGRVWPDRGVEHLISIADFKASGDIDRFRALWEEKFGKKRKPRPQPDAPEADEEAEATAGAAGEGASEEESAATVH